MLALDQVRTLGLGAAALTAALLLVLTGVSLGLRGARKPRATISDQPATAWTVSVEVVLLSAAADDTLRYRVVSSPATASLEPDASALALSGLGSEPAAAGALLHATSWRCTAPGHLVVTYAALPDTTPTGTVDLTAPSIVCSADPLRPAPALVHAHHVAAHGVRHLAYLHATDPTVAAAGRENQTLWRKILAAAAGMPVAEHEHAHSLAAAARVQLPRASEGSTTS